MRQSLSEDAADALPMATIGGDSEGMTCKELWPFPTARALHSLACGDFIMPNVGPKCGFDPWPDGSLQRVTLTCGRDGREMNDRSGISTSQYDYIIS